MTDNQTMVAIVAALAIGFWAGKRRAAACACQQATQAVATTDTTTVADPMAWLTGWGR